MSDTTVFQPKPGEKWVSTTRGMSGYFAVIYWINDEHHELGPFIEPYDTGAGRYATLTEAIEEAEYLATELNLQYVPENGKCVMPLFE